MEFENENTTDFFGLEQIRNLNLEDNFPDLDFDIDLELNLQFELFTNTNSNPNNNIETDQTFKKNFLFQDVPEKCHQHSLDHFSEHGENNGDYFGIPFEKVSGQEDFDQDTNEELNRKELSELSEFNNLDQYQEFTELRNSSELNGLFSLIEKFEPFEPNENNDNSLSLTDQIRSSSKMILNPTEQPTITATKTTQNETQNVNEKQIQQETVTEEQPTPKGQPTTKEQKTTQEQTTIKEQTTIEEQIPIEEQITTKIQPTTKRKSNRRKRIKEKFPLKKVNSMTIESGKELFKCMTGLLWVISHGSSIKQLKPFTNELSDKLTSSLNASIEEKNIFSNQLKNLLSNSRRTFSEFIMEIMVGILSLNYKSNTKTAKVSHKYEKLVNSLSKIENFNSISLQEQERFKKN